MKFILATLLLVPVSAFANFYLPLNLSENLKSIGYFSIFGCDGAACLGVKLTVPTGSKVSVKGIDAGECQVNESEALEFLGGDTYIVDANLLEGSTQACVISVVPVNGKKAQIRLVNEQSAL